MKWLGLLLALGLGIGALAWLLEEEPRSDGTPVVVVAQPDSRTTAQPTTRATLTDTERRLEPETTEPAPKVTRQAQGTTTKTPKTIGKRSVEGRLISENGPVIGAQVYLFSGDARLGEVTSDSQGAFRFEFMATAETATLRAVARGYAPYELNLQGLAGSQARQLGNVSLQRSLLLRGVVYDSEGRAVEGAQIEIRTSSSRTYSNDYVHSGLSDSKGRFHVQDVPPGRLRIAAAAPGRGYGTMTHYHQDDKVVELRLRPPASLTVQVLDHERSPVKGATVELNAYDQNATPRTGTTDAKGKVSWNDLDATSWQIRVVADDYIPRQKRNVVADGRVESIELGRWPCLEGRVVTSAGTPPPEGTVISVLAASQRGRRATGAGIGGDFTDEDGNFRVCGLRSGDYVVRAEADGYAPTQSRAVRLELNRDARIGTIRLHEGGELLLKLSGPSGALPKARVQLFESAPQRARLWNPDLATTRPPVRSGTADESGQLLLEHLAPGMYWLMVHGDGVVPRSEGPVRVIDNERREHEAKALEAGGELVGIVRDEADNPQVGAVVILSGNELVGSSIHVRTDDQGRYVSPPLPAGTFILQARPVGAKRTSDRVTTKLKPGEKKTVDLRL